MLEVMLSTTVFPQNIHSENTGDLCVGNPAMNMKRVSVSKSSGDKRYILRILENKVNRYRNA